MALKDLIASKASLAEDVIEDIVSDFVRFDPDHKAVVFTAEAHDLSSKGRVLVYLVALQGWPFVAAESIPVDAKPGEIEEQTGIIGGTLRPILKELKDRNVIVERGGRYSVRAVALQAIKAELGGSSSSLQSKSKKRSRRQSRRASDHEAALEKKTTGEVVEKRIGRSSDSNKLAERFSALIDEGFFDKGKTLAEVQKQFHKEAIIVPQTSIPFYLLKGIRSGRLERDKEDVNGKLVWVYKRKRKA